MGLMKTVQAPIVILHTPGMFTRDTYRSPQLFIPRVSKYYEFIFEYEIHNALAFGTEEPCTNDKAHDFDLCIHTEIEKESMERFGCTTPFGPNKDSICTNKTIGWDALQFY